MSKKKENERKAKNPAAGKTAAGANKGSGRAAQPAKRTTAKNNRSVQGKKQPQRTHKKNDNNKKTVAEITTEKKTLIQRLIEALKQRIAQKKAQKEEEKETVFPKKFPFWARLKIGKKRTTLVIDEETIKNKRSKKVEPHFVQREAIHSHGDGSNVKGYEKIEPNPDPTDKDPMYLKRPTKLPKRLFKPHNKELDMPEYLKQRYEKNNNDK